MYLEENCHKIYNKRRRYPFTNIVIIKFLAY